MSAAIPPLPNMPSWRGAQLKHRDNFTFTFRGRMISSAQSWNANSNPTRGMKMVMCFLVWVKSFVMDKSLSREHSQLSVRLVF
jgi:hypothetical protein